MGRSEARMVAAEHRRARHQVSGVDPMRTQIGMMIFLETHRRILGGQFGRIPDRLSKWAFAEGGYCLDAPELLPAGGCEFMDLDPTGMEDQCDEFGHFGLPAQMTVLREPSSTDGVGDRDAA